MGTSTSINLELSGLEALTMRADAFIDNALQQGGEELLRVIELLIYYRETQFHASPGDAASAVIDRVMFALGAPKCIPIWPVKSGLSRQQINEIHEWEAWSGVPAPLELAQPPP
jgi:hypothetical protein